MFKGLNLSMYDAKELVMTQSNFGSRPCSRHITLEMAFNLETKKIQVFLSKDNECRTECKKVQFPIFFRRPLSWSCRKGHWVLDDLASDLSSNTRWMISGPHAVRLATFQEYQVDERWPSCPRSSSQCGARFVLTVQALE